MVNKETAEILSRIQVLLREAKHVMVVSHVDPDGDAIGSVLAFGQYLSRSEIKVTMVRDSEIPEKYRFLPSVERIIQCGSLPPGFSCDTVVVLECPDVKRMGAASELFGDEATVINIDHHTGNGNYGTVNWIDVDASSVGELLCEYFDHVQYPIDYEAAVQLYTAILTDTGRFRYDATSPRTMEIAGKLMSLGLDTDDICRQVYYNESPSRLRLLGAALRTLEYHAGGTVCLLTLTNQMYAEAGSARDESDGIVDYAMHSRGVLVGALIKEADAATTRCSLRSIGDIDVASVARKFGGGGHRKAAGCSISKPLAQAKTEIISLLTEATGVVRQSV